MTGSGEHEVLFHQAGGLGRITLNRPKALNALTLGMVRDITRTLTDWAADPSVRMVLLEGAGGRGLCAGGDIRALHASGLARDGMAETFWREEYALNVMIAEYPKPYVALMDGVVMGGGVGLSAHGKHRVVTELTLVAMPEVGIGFFPDVGGTWLLSHAPGALGVLLALTGAGMGASDAILAGFADVMISTETIPALIDSLREIAGTEDDIGTAVDERLRTLSVSPQTGPLGARREDIDRVFSQASVEDCIAAARSLDDIWGREQAAILETRSPTSLKVTFEAIRRAARLPTLRECLAMEFTLALRMLAGADFYEGVRAQVIDKDRKPKWSPGSLAEVSTGAVDAMFEPLEAVAAL